MKRHAEYYSISGGERGGPTFFDWCASPRCAALCCSALFCAALCRAVPWRGMLGRTAARCAVLPLGLLGGRRARSPRRADRIGAEWGWAGCYKERAEQTRAICARPRPPALASRWFSRAAVKPRPRPAGPPVEVRPENFSGPGPGAGSPLPTPVRSLCSAGLALCGCRGRVEGAEHSVRGLDGAECPPKEAKLAAPVQRGEPKTYMANERTFLAW